MPKHGLNSEFKMETRDRYTKVDTNLTISVEGPELPNLSVIGNALDEAVELVKTRIKESYQVVPDRVETPIAKPYGGNDE